MKGHRPSKVPSGPRSRRMRKNEREAKAIRRIERRCDEADAKILRIFQETIQWLERERLEYAIAKRRRSKAK